ncbi:GntR family transcriptional regulator [Chelativorans intermedius]|uniref:GntR family transcriptional regulator n=1 Tax=Chelativorans intermedius TaxID=515947 RepID=A0ABV6D2F7_9HYPH|nr:GntR family transcriptional regulator [Chelativorans intermedius]MCT8997360.1 GntR family transcriptional regulator [Chelativorans intermedius]
MAFALASRRGREATARVSKSAEVFEGIKRAIMLGEVVPGEALLELELAEYFGCSQGTVREALLNLQDEGLVVRMGHRGTRVSDCTRDEAVEMFRLRHGIETRGIRRAVQRINDKGLEELRHYLSAMIKAARAKDEYALADFDRSFHMSLFQAADLPAVEPLLSRCILHNQRFKILRSGEQRDLNVTARRHEVIIEALEARDEEAAIRAISHHVATIVDFGPALFEQPAQEEGA